MKSRLLEGRTEEIMRMAGRLHDDRLKVSKSSSIVVVVGPLIVDFTLGKQMSCTSVFKIRCKFFVVVYFDPENTFLYNENKYFSG